MKEVIKGKELEEITINAINMLCDTVKKTLGPKGSSVLINNSETQPFITNDGVTIAKSIESSDTKINSILEIIKEAALKTDELVGDGTTTTLVLLQSIYLKGLNEIKKGYSAIKLQRELNDTLNKVLDEIDKLKKKPTKTNLEQVASISANDIELGKIITELYLKMGNSYSINIEESLNNKTYYEIKKGYKLDVDISNLYNNIIINNCYVLLLKGYLNSLEDISSIINEGIERNKNILILCEDTNELVIQEVILYYIKQHKNIFLFKIPDYGSRKLDIINDISLISKAKIKNIEYDNISFEDLGILNNIFLNKEDITLISDNNYNIKDIEQDYINCTSDYDKEYLAKRLSYLTNGVATLYIGGNTKVEIKEKKMRAIDALSSINSAEHGVLIGEGITLMKASNILNDNIISEKILKETLNIPFEVIMENSGEDINAKEEIIKSNYQLVFNTEKKDFENISKTSILDSIDVVKTSLINALSIATILLTTNSLVINEKIINKDIEI